MADILTPALGESVTEATIAKWSKAAGEAVTKDEVLVELETDKVSLEVVAPADGVLSEIKAEAGATVVPGTVLGVVTEGAAAAKPAEAPKAEPKAEPAPAAAPADSGSAQVKSGEAPHLSPAVQRVVSETGVDPQSIVPTGPKGNVTKADALAAAAAPKAPAAAPAAPRADQPREERVKMTRLRQTIARRLKESQNSAAQLTTFNEVDMSAVMDIRTKYKDAFEKRHGIKLGFMSFFVKAVVEALKEIPAVNAEIDGTDIIYKNHYAIGVAVGTDKGLVVPVLRDADVLSLAGIEKGIADLGKAARDGDLTLDQLQGGTFTITNGGIYGSLMSTPILNMPQSGILGMHNIVQRPVAIGGQVVIRPMMYLALSYDHRIVDGKEAVTFLVRIKEHLEDPQRFLLDL
ncbi:MAG: 2-oxoglutarate dehydrogenase complex dihydrolipoyllysine-residue succinyltransferase [Alphaproteobacteria bacterium]|nr:2-oxoglutarate dehydrogenase complex dihydrolipoyllysine-residue succinyltransferase [Alphaproteobacteria bacterium]MBU1527048.1 2-oxoglutarate dehydrogenase complex dihydrolipoyllysine-residue succinyltransferase [Alphaproteobacteria bacterium]MBU2352385.1 2-oxoglutarate dehydrogenase complex dihydrolipoyllysine-residue succinyltransferase [Alphaproteobacteria bacterium]MBU2382145.1 2-oxoglutarate dehydrogenase complex dihydrolipoyllysine-residue succinyltransferase [Alphaproteobacteria bact